MKQALINSQFRNAVPQKFAIAEIAGFQTIDACKQPRFRLAVGQTL